jgi:multiple sugar transport system substrate-binding protein
MFAAGPVGNGIMVKNTGYMPVHTKAVDPAFYSSNPNFKTSVDQIPYAFRWYSFPGQNNLKIIDTIKDSLQATVAKQKEPEAAIQEAAQKTSQLIQ